MQLRRILTLTSFVAVPVALAAQNPPAPASTAAAQPIVVNAPQVTFKAGPPSLPPGAEFVVLEGNPAESGPITFRLKFPPNYKIPPHSHHGIEHVTVMSGTLNVGMGEQANYTGGAQLKEGAFGVIPANMVHYAWTGPDGVTIQLHSTGPWTITYVNATDDPRNKPRSSN